MLRKELKMTKVKCPLEPCTYNLKKECGLEAVSLTWRGAFDIPKSGTMVLLECDQYEGPSDRDKKEIKSAA